MASEPNGIEVVGEMADMYGDKVALKRDGDVVIVAFDDGLGTYFAMCFDAERRDQFIKLWAETERRAEAHDELLDRAAMPGQVPQRPAPSSCRSCGAGIGWAKDPDGKRVPVNHGGDPDGGLAVQAAPDGTLMARYLRKDGVLTMHEWRAASHFATCPDAAKWRERGQAVDGG